MKKEILKKILVPALAAVAFGSVSVGATFALFTSEAETTIEVGAGKIDVSSSLSVPSLYSADPTLTSGDIAGVLTGDYAGTYYYKLQSGSFANGGTASVTGSTLAVERMTPGDKVVTSLGFTNQSDIAIKYRLTVQTAQEHGTELLKDLDLKILGTVYHGLKYLQTKWTTIAPGASIAGSDLELIFPLESGNEAQNKDARFVFSLEAVQANALTTDGDKAEYYVDATSTTEYLTPTDITVDNTIASAKTLETDLPSETVADKTVKVDVPEGVKLEEDASSLKLYVENMGEDPAYQGIVIDVEEGAEIYEVTLEGIDENNTQPITVTADLGYEPLRIYHIHGEAPYPEIPFTYDPNTGLTTFTTTNFSEFTFIRDTDIIEVPNLAKLKIVRDYINEGNSLAGKTVKLLTDIDLGDEAWTPIGTPEHPFGGIFDGNNKTISHFNVTGSDYYAGFFGYVEGTANSAYDSCDDIWNNDALVEAKIAESNYTAVIKNLTIDHASLVSAKKFSGAVVAFGNNVYLKNCNVSNAQVETGKCAGGLAGTLNGSVIKDCVTAASVTINATKYHAGGLVGAISYYDHNDRYPSPCMPSAIVSSENNAPISVVNRGGDSGSYGGIVALANAASGTGYLSAIIGCENKGAITVDDSDYSAHNYSLIGGIAASAQGVGLFANCVNSGALTLVSSWTKANPAQNQKNYVSGIVASMGNTGEIDGIYHCRNTANISATVASDVDMVAGLAVDMAPNASHPAFVDGCSNTGTLVCQNTSHEDKGYVSDIVTEIYASTGKVIYKNMSFADLSALSKAIPQRITGYENSIIEIDESVAVADKTGVLELGCLRRFKGYDGLCERFTFTTDLPGTSGSTRSAYVDIPNAKLYIAANQTINNNVLDLLADGMGIINYGTFRGGVELFGANVEIVNYGSFIANNGNLISLYGGSGTVTNNGTLNGVGVAIYAAGTYTVDGATPWLAASGLTMTHEGNVYTVIAAN